ncbi:MAG TPA: hypothetical protein VHR45_20880 [Thermoanaerobaculia bacterium]|nr:hypothetical protein [Thermoanaerobaculia bacterium]
MASADDQPRVLFKYLPTKFLADVLRGRILFRNLAYFQQVEDTARGDLTEGMHIDKPDNPVTVESQDGRVNIQGAFAFHSEVNQERVFAFCLSTRLAPELLSEFGCDACVEIFDVSGFVARVRAAVRRSPTLAKVGLLAGPVEYYRTNDTAQMNIKDPTKLPFFKPVRFSSQFEYRLVCAQGGGLGPLGR